MEREKADGDKSSRKAMECLRETPEGVLLDVEVSTGSKKEGVQEYDIWRKRLAVSTSARPVKGEANESLIEVLAAFFGVRSGDISIVSGHKSRFKTFLIKSLSLKEASERILNNIVIHR